MPVCLPPVPPSHPSFEGRPQERACRKRGMTVRVARIASLLALASLLLVGHASSAGVAAPKSLHGFLLRADEPTTAVFHRTPSFAWAPVPGARTYQFQIATSDTFRDNGVLYSNAHLVTPVAAPSLTLPWITGSPHALYARARARTRSTLPCAPSRPTRPLPGARPSASTGLHRIRRSRLRATPVSFAGLPSKA